MTPTSRPSRAAAPGSVLRRVGRSWRALEAEQRTAAGAALALFVTMFLPWYSQTVLGNDLKGGKPRADGGSLSAWGAFSFVEAAVLLVAVSVLWMLFARGEGKAFHLPFGDGNVIFAAGVWVCLLVFYRQFDKPSPAAGPGVAVTVGVSWGIFVTFLTGLFLAFSGQRLRGAHLAEPPLPGSVAPSDEPPPRGRRQPAEGRRPADQRPRPGRDVAPTVVDRRPGPSFDDTLAADVPEYPVPGAPPPSTDVARHAGSAPADPPRPTDPPTARTRVARADEQLRLGEDEARTRADGQLRFDDDR